MKLLQKKKKKGLPLPTDTSYLGHWRNALYFNVTVAHKIIAVQKNAIFLVRENKIRETQQDPSGEIEVWQRWLYYVELEGDLNRVRCDSEKHGLCFALHSSI